MKGVHPVYQDQVVFNNDDVGVALIKPWKLLTQSSMAMITVS